MSFLNHNVDKFNELVFQNRNKSYGAYAIRKAYSNTLMRACFFTVSGMMAIMGSILYLTNASATGPISMSIGGNEISDTIVYNATPPEPVQKATTPPASHDAPASAAPNTAISTHIDDHAVETHSVDVENPVSGQGDPDARGTSLTSTVTTTNTAVGSTVTAVTATVDAEPVSWAPEMPEYEGGDAALIRFLGSNMVYPVMAKEAGKEGTVYVSFVVDEAGYVKSAKVLRGIGYGCDEEALRVVNKLPRWKKPGRNGDRPVKVRFNLPISFKLK